MHILSYRSYIGDAYNSNFQIYNIHIYGDGSQVPTKKLKNRNIEVSEESEIEILRLVKKY